MASSPTTLPDGAAPPVGPHVLVTAKDGETRRIPARDGASVMEILRDGGIEELPAYCGGACSCASCHVHVAPEWADKLPPIGEDEAILLESAANRAETSRLSCQIAFSAALSGLPVRTACTD